MATVTQVSTMARCLAGDDFSESSFLGATEPHYGGELLYAVEDVESQLGCIPDEFRNLYIPKGVMEKRVLLLALYDYRWISQEKLFEIDVDGLINYYELNVKTLPLPQELTSTTVARVSSSSLSAGVTAKSTFPDSLYILKTRYNKNNRDKTEIDILQGFHNAGISFDDMVFSRRGHASEIGFHLRDGIRPQMATVDNEFGPGFYASPSLIEAIAYATIRGPAGIILVFDKSILLAGMFGRVKKLSESEWKKTLMFYLVGRGEATFKDDEVSLVMGPISENHGSIISRRAGPKASDIDQWVVINDFTKLEAALTAVVYFE